MGYGGGIALIVIGLILALAINDQTVGPVELGTIGWILTLAGIVVIVLTAVQANMRQRRTTTATTTHADGTQTQQERTTRQDPPPPAV